MKEKIIDISEHNGTIDFAKVKESGINKAILRIGWIGNKDNHTIDKKFNEYYSKCRYYNIKVGIYVYSYCNNLKAIKSACRWVEKNLYNKTIDLPVFIDLEDTTIYPLSQKELTDHAVEFCKYFENLGYKSGVYASKYWFNNKLDINKLLNYKIWLAEWNGQENHTFKYRVDLWQYTSDGHVDGIKTRVDMNYCLCECNNSEKKEEFEVAKVYKNGSTRETVFADSNCTKVIGSLNINEKCECLGIVNNRYIVKYKVDGADNYKVGFVRYNGGIK